MRVARDESLTLRIIADRRAFRFHNRKTKARHTHVLFKRTTRFESLKQLRVFYRIFAVRLTVPSIDARPEGFGTDTNDVNAMKAMGLVPETIVNHYLTDTDAWFLRTDVPHGMKHFERRADGFDMDNDFDTENAKFKATARYSFGWTDPRGLFGSPGA